MEKKPLTDEEEADALLAEVERDEKSSKPVHEARLRELDAGRVRRGMAPRQRPDRPASPLTPKNADREIEEAIQGSEQAVRNVREAADRTKRALDAMVESPLEEQCDAVYGDMSGALRKLVREGIAGIRKAQQALTEEERVVEEDERLQREGKLPPVG